jgi:hypothetical protein
MTDHDKWCACPECEARRDKRRPPFRKPCADKIGDVADQMRLDSADISVIDKNNP